ncbi:MAG TPA: WD40 repeat domain-containing protein, partial [Blastocatellia bacterium]
MMFKSPHTYKAAFIIVVLALSCGPVLASGPIFWEITKQDDVVKGDARGVSIADNGTIMLAPAYTLVYDTKEAYIWSNATDSAGNTYLGTGHDGKIFKVDSSGAGRLLYDAAELDVTALTTDSQGNLYAGTSPDGKIYKITSDGQQSVFYDPVDKYIWSLVYEAGTSTLYAGTGDKGIIYKIDAAGKAAVLTDTNETNIVSLALDKSGNVLAGTDPSGLVLRVSPAGKVFALFDSPSQEIHSLNVAADGTIYALGISQQGATAQKQASLGVSSTSSLSSEGVITISTTEDQDSTASSQATDVSSVLSQSQGRSKADGARSAVFRILPDGGNEVYWRTNDVVAFGLKPLPDGRVLVSTGSKGRIYQIAPDRTHTLLVQSPEDQTSTIFMVGDQLYATSSNLGRLYRIGRDSVSEGTYTSPVRDTKFAGQWGVITWRGSGNVELQTRSGNTETPDTTWSDWSTSYRSMAGDQITSPRARFIQWRAVLRSGAQAGEARTTRGNQPGASQKSSAQLESVAVAYLPRNQAPDITSVSVQPPGVAFQEQPLSIDPSIASSGLDPQVFGIIANVPPRRYFQKGARTINWVASDPNDDTLVYSLMYRALGDNDWHLLADNLSQAYYTIDGNRLPDGTYFFKVMASDAPGNPSALTLSDEKTTDAVELDNTPPSVKVTGPLVTGQTAEVTFDTTDLTSRIVRGEYSVDGGAWQLVFPADGIADSAHESFKVRAAFDKPGEHVIAFRCADSSSNIGTSKVTATM